MKISSEYNNSYLFQMAKKNEANEKRDEQQMVKNQTLVQVDISKEAMAKYREEIKKNTPAEEDEKIHWLNTEDYTMNCVKINEKDENGNALSVKKQAQNLLEDYASKYRRLAKGYDDGTIKIYSEDDENRVLTKEEALQKLTESFEDHAKSLEERTKQQDQSAQMLEDAIRRSSVWKNSSQRAQQFLAAQDKKKENPENLSEHFSENVIKAGAMFRDKFVKNGQENNVSIQNLLSDISLW